LCVYLTWCKEDEIEAEPDEGGTGILIICEFEFKFVIVVVDGILVESVLIFNDDELVIGDMFELDFECFILSFIITGCLLLTEIFCDDEDDEVPSSCKIFSVVSLWEIFFLISFNWIAIFKKKWYFMLKFYICI